jgi:zinc protease
MFEGSKNLPKREIDQLLEKAGGTNNGSTTTDRTNYWDTVPPDALQLALHLEADRMGWFLETMTQEKLDGQRDVVKNERRQSYENRPYGLAYETMMAQLYPKDHPYHWPVIGWMDDLDAANLNDVMSFFQTYYAPNNASLAIAGDVATDHALELVEQHFGAIPAAKTPPRPGDYQVTPAANAVTLEDDVYLPRIYIAWHSPALLQPGDAEMDIAAEILGTGKAARLYRRLVHDLQIAQEVEAYNNSGQLASSLVLSVTAQEGVTLDRLEAEVHEIVQSLANEPGEREVERGRNHIETVSLDSLQSVGGFGGKADRLNHYFFYAGDADALQRDMDRYSAATPQSVHEHLSAVVSKAPVTIRVEPRS